MQLIDLQGMNDALDSSFSVFQSIHQLSKDVSLCPTTFFEYTDTDTDTEYIRSGAFFCSLIFDAVLVNRNSNFF